MKLNFKLICAVFMLSSSTYATDGSSGNSFYEMMFGNPNQRKAVRERNENNSVTSESCDGYGGFLGVVNGFFCHMEKDMGITGVGSATKTFAPPGQSGMTVRAEVTQSAVTINSIAYEYQAKVWVCLSGCTSTSNFNRAFYIAFSYSPGSGVNKGYVLTAPGAFESSQSGSAMELEYDIGSAVATQSVKAKAVFIDGASTFRMRALGEKTSSSLKVSMAGHDGTNGFRFAMSTTPDFSATKYMNMYHEGSGGAGSNGSYALDAAGIAAPATGNGYCLSGAEAGTSMSVVAVSSTNCSSLSFLAFDHTSNGAAPTANSLTAGGILGSWQNMAANPSSL